MEAEATGTTVPGDDQQCQVTVKTLDSQNHTFTVSKSMGVKDFKAEITEKIGITADQQRLIFRGRVLQDDKKISDYDVANNTIHVVQRPATTGNSRSNDEPSRNSRGSDRNTNAALLMGTIGIPNIDIQAQAGQNPLGAFGRRAGASVRLQLSSRMLTQASSMLRRLEDDDTISLETPAPTAPTYTQETSAPVPAPVGESQSDQDQVGSDSGENRSPMDIDGEDSNTFGRIISQVANAASAAAIMAAIRQGSDDPSGAGPGIGMAENGGTGANNTATGTGAAGAGADPSQRRPDVPAAPRLREMGVVIQDILAFHERLGPYLQYVRGTLQQNRDYEDVGEQQSTQYVFDTVSSILHYLSHSYHALSDIICDFSTPSETRRLRAATAILVEQSTVVRATIPIGANFSNVNVNTTANTRNPSAPAPTAATAAPASTGVPGVGVHFPATPTNTNTNSTAPSPMPPVNNNTAAATGANSNTAGAGGGNTNPNPNPTPNPMFSNNPQMQQFFANMANLGRSAGAGGAGSGGGIQEIHVNIGGPPPTGSGPGPGQGQQYPQMGVGVPIMSGIPGVSVMMGVGPGDPTGQPINLANLGALGLGAGGGGMNFNLQDLTAMLGPALGGIMPMFNQNQGQQQQQQNQNSNSTPQTQTGTGTATANINTSNASAGGVGVGVNGIGSGFQVQLSPFDLLLACSSHHGSRNQQNQRPANFRRYVNPAPMSSSTSTSSSTTNEDFTLTLSDVFFNSNVLPLLQPLLQEIIVNYLMRGRDSKNKDHMRSCAKSMAKKLSGFFELFSIQVAGRNGNISYPETFTNLLIHYLTEMMHLTMNSSTSDFKAGVLSACESFFIDLLSVFRVCFSGCDGYVKNFSSFVIEQVLSGTSLAIRENSAKRLHDYLLRIDDPSKKPPDSVIVYKETTAAAASTSTTSAGSSRTDPVPLPPAQAPTRVPIGTVSPRSAAVLPPKQPRPSPRCEMRNSVDMDEDIDDDLLSMRAAAPAPPAMWRVQPTLNPHNIEAMLRNIPSEWVETVRNDFMRQLGMPEQPPFSPGYVALLSRKQ